jgi:surface antigen
MILINTNVESNVRPKKGSLLIWAPEGKFKPTGHVAVITKVQDDYVDIAEQNVEDAVWPDGVQYSRRLPATVSQEGFELHCTYSDSKILGWMNIMADKPYKYEVTKNNSKINDSNTDIRSQRFKHLGCVL